MMLFEYAKSVREAWGNFIEDLLDSSPIGRLAKRVVEREQTMSMISEQIEELRLMAEMFVNGEPYGNLLRRAANTIEMLSEKAREPKRGEWICHEGRWIDFDYYPTEYECNQCHHYVDVASDKNFCPNCGARMKGADNEQMDI